jgi:hypothetical protein
MTSRTLIPEIRKTATAGRSHLCCVFASVRIGGIELLPLNVTVLACDAATVGHSIFHMRTRMRVLRAISGKATANIVK